MNRSAPIRRSWQRFRNVPCALPCLIALLVTVLSAVALSPFAAAWYDVQSRSHVRHSPTLEPARDTVFQSRLNENLSARPIQQLMPAARRTVGLFGYDDLGRSIFLRTVMGWLISMGIGLSAAVTAVVVGVTWGATAAWFGSKTDALMMRIVDIFYGLPYVLLVIVLKVVFENRLQRVLGARSAMAGVVVLLLAVGLVSWLTMARVVRGQVLSLKHRAFVEAARAAGASTPRIIIRHLLPNLIGPVIVYALLIVPQAILQESFLSFLGIGVQPPLPSLGNLVADGVDAVNGFVSFWWILVFPCAALVLTLLLLTLVGDGLRDALDPQSKGSPGAVHR